MAIELAPEIERQVRSAAAAEGRELADYVREALEEKLHRGAFPIVAPKTPPQMTEGELLEAINRGFPEAFWKRYRALAARRDSEKMTKKEQREIIAMSDQMEERAGQRLEYVIELARRRNVTVDFLMKEMGIRPVAI